MKTPNRWVMVLEDQHGREQELSQNLIRQVEAAVEERLADMGLRVLSIGPLYESE